MLPLPAFTLHSPGSVGEALTLLDRFGTDAALIAGGTDILPNMKRGVTSPLHLVSLRAVTGLAGVRQEQGWIHVGAMTTLDAIAHHPLLREHASALSEAAAMVGGPQHRKMGTLGGNLCLDTRCRYFNQTYFWRSALGFCLKKDGTVCHVVKGGQKCVAAASNDSASAAIALEAQLELVGSAGSRTIAARDFYTTDGIQNTTRAPGEIVTALRIPMKEGRSSAYEKLRRRGAIDFPLLSVAARADLTGDHVDALEIVVSALAARPRPIRGANELAAGKSRAEIPADRIAQVARKESTPLANIEGDAAWRREMVVVLVGKALQRLKLGS